MKTKGIVLGILALMIVSSVTGIVSVASATEKENGTIHVANDTTEKQFKQMIEDNYCLDKGRTLNYSQKVACFYYPFNTPVVGQPINYYYNEKRSGNVAIIQPTSSTEQEVYFNGKAKAQISKIRIKWDMFYNKWNAKCGFGSSKWDTLSKDKQQKCLNKYSDKIYDQLKDRYDMAIEYNVPVSIIQ